jgi:hypothetical protein
MYNTFFSGGKLFNFKNMAAANDDVKISSCREDKNKYDTIYFQCRSLLG